MKGVQGYCRPIDLGRLVGAAGLGGAVALGVLMTASTPVQAQAAYGSYVGIGPSFGLTKGGQADQGREISGVIAGRYKFLELPFSIRTQALIGSHTALVPTVSYDFPINWQTDVYIGAGAAFPIGGNTPVGDQTSFAIQPGVDYAVPNSNLVIFGNAVIGINGYKGGGTATSLQGGVGVRF
jgi:hypothetical protein